MARTKFKLVEAPKFQIIKNAPLPERGSGSSDRAAFGTFGGYPFAEMKIGDAFDAPRDMGRTRKGADGRQAHVSKHASTYSSFRDKSFKCATRIIDDNTVRVWRIA
jgi:hypothetical protein